MLSARNAVVSQRIINSCLHGKLHRSMGSQDISHLVGIYCCRHQLGFPWVKILSIKPKIERKDHLNIMWFIYNSPPTQFIFYNAYEPSLK